MAFLLIGIDKKPMLLKGKRQFAGVAVLDAQGELPIGSYRGVRSGELIHVYSSAGRVLPSREAATAFSFSNPIPVTTDESMRNVPDPLGEVFVLENSQAVLQELQFSATPLQDVKGHWIPANFFQGEVQIGTGWVKQREATIDVRIISNKLRDENGWVRVVPVFVPEIAFDIG